MSSIEIEMKQLRAEAQTLRAENERLRAVLKPLVAAARKHRVANVIEVQEAIAVLAERGRS